MSTSFQPPPTWALPILVDEQTQKAIFNPVWLKWFVDLTGVLNSSGVGSGTVQHNDTGGLQGGNTNQYYHLTSSEVTALIGGGNSSGHYHAADRARAVHTGTQTASTISDFNEAAQDAIGSALTNSASIEFTYDAGANTVTATAKPAGIDHGGLGGLGDDDHAQYVLASGARNISGQQEFEDNIVLPKTSGKGILVDTATPTYGWRDLLGIVQPKTSGVGSPTLATFRAGQVRRFCYAAGEDGDGEFHIPHDWAPGTDLYFHVYWGHNGTTISGSLVIDFYFTYAKGHNQANFSPEINATLTVNTPNIATVPQYRHRTDEFQLSATSPSATQLDTDDLEVDGLILFHWDVTTIPTITGGSPSKPFLFYMNLHYQSTGMATKAKSPNFYA